MSLDLDAMLAVVLGYVAARLAEELLALDDLVDRLAELLAVAIPPLPWEGGTA